MKRVAFTTLGCKLNFSETSGISRQFEESGYQTVEAGAVADVYVINTCTVTEIANKKSRQAIKKMAKQNPEAKIVAVGCYSQLKSDEVAAIEGVDLVLGSDNKFNILSYLDADNAKNDTQIVVDDKKKQVFNPTYSFGDRTRSFLKVQDGCDYYCSYCAIPRARGNSKNQSVEATVKVARASVEKGAREIILTGVNIGDFGRSTNENLLELLKSLEQIDDLHRIRISSIEPNLLSEAIISHVAVSEKILPHFHIPLQCGTDNLLRNMRRRYTTSLYTKRVSFIKNLMPHAAIAADVIVGVPGETQEEFNQALEYIRELPLSYLHVFTYSERENTLAIRMENQVPAELRKQRSEIMHKLAKQKHQEFHKQHLGQIREVLFEGQFSKTHIFGFTDNYIRVEVPVNDLLVNKTVKVKLEEQLDNGNVRGILV